MNTTDLDDADMILKACRLEYLDHPYSSPPTPETEGANTAEVTPDCASCPHDGVKVAHGAITAE